MNDISKLKMLRMVKGYSQKGIAKKLNITQQAYSKIENGQTKIDEARFKQILKALQCTPEEFKKMEILASLRK